MTSHHSLVAYVVISSASRECFCFERLRLSSEERLVKGEVKYIKTQQIHIGCTYVMSKKDLYVIYHFYFAVFVFCPASALHFEEC